MILKVVALLAATALWAVVGGRGCDQWYQQQYEQFSHTSDR